MVSLKIMMAPLFLGRTYICAGVLVLINSSVLVRSIACRFSWAAWLVVGLFISAPSSAEWINQKRAIMGTTVEVELWHGDSAIGRNAVEAVFHEMIRLDKLLSPYKPESMISQINREAAAGEVVVDEETFWLINKAVEFSELSHGAFDITFASVGYLYDYRNHKLPTEAQRLEKKSAIDYRHIRLDPLNKTVSFKNKAVKIDLGGIAKGYACDRGIKIIKELGIQHGIVSAGGDSKILGDKRGRPWMIGIKDPRGDQSIINVPVENVALSTSGDYERFFIKEATRYHHIIDPSTGSSAGELTSVTIIADEGVYSDALSTAVFVLGVDEGLALINRLANTSAIIIDKQGRLFYSADLESL